MSHDACRVAIAEAVRYVCRLTADWSMAQIRQARHRPDVQAQEAEMERWAAAGDLANTKSACRAWWTAIRACAPAPQAPQEEATHGHLS